jgi:hypothetical protein
MCTGLRDDLEGAKVLLGELLRQSGGTEEFRQNKGVLSDLEVRSWRSAFIGRSLVALLGFGNVFA